jgi:uncharacterized UPF0160 family protein
MAVERIPRSFGTHNGMFHADEVTACALLIVFDRVDLSKVIRTRDTELLAQCDYVCDVGGVYDPASRRFDHHQLEYQGEMSSAGMVWLYLRDTGAVDQKLYDYVNRQLILGVDAHDNGKVIPDGSGCSFSNVVSNFAPPVYDATPQELQEAFFLALGFVQGHLRRLLERYRYLEGCRDAVATVMAKRERVLVFDRALPWIENFFDLGGAAHPALFVVMPTGPHWKLRGIPPTNDKRMQVRVPLPEAWAGLLDADLRRASGIEGAVFCHKGRFISVWETKEAALRALEEALRGVEG